MMPAWLSPVPDLAAFRIVGTRQYVMSDIAEPVKVRRKAKRRYKGSPKLAVILELVKANPGLRTRELVVLSPLERLETYYKLRNLKVCGMVRSEGPPRQCRWYAV